MENKAGCLTLRAGKIPESTRSMFIFNVRLLAHFFPLLFKRRPNWCVIRGLVDATQFVVDAGFYQLFD